MIANSNMGLAQIVDRMFYEQDHPEERSGRPWENPANPIDTRDPSYSVSTPSNVVVNESIALTYAPVWQAVSLISGDIAKLDMLLCRRVHDRICDRLWDHPLTDLVHRRPNDDLDATTFWRRTVLHYLVYGNAYIWVRRDPESGEPIDLIHLLPNRTYPIRHPEDDYKIWYWAGMTTPPWHFPIPARDVIHVEWLQDVPYEIAGVNTTRAARNSWGLGIAQETFASRFFAHGGRIGGILELPSAMTRDSKERVSTDFKQSYEGNEAAFKTVILRDNAKFHQGQFNFRETQLVEGSEQQARQTARWFNLPPDKLGVDGAASYNSKQEDNRNYIEQTLGIIMKLICSRSGQRLMTTRQRRSHVFQHDTREMLAPDPPAKMDMAIKGFGGNILTVNESRAFIGLPPASKDGDKFARDMELQKMPDEGAQTGSLEGGSTPESGSGNTESRASAEEFDELRVMLPVLSHAKRCTKSPGSVIDFCEHGAKPYVQEAMRYMGNASTVNQFFTELRKAPDRATETINEWETRYAADRI